jgi:putative transposase
MADPNETSSRAAKIADVLRPLGRGPLSKEQAVFAADLLGVHWTTVYRLRRRFLADPVAERRRSAAPRPFDGRPSVGNGCR